MEWADSSTTARGNFHHVAAEREIARAELAAESLAVDTVR